MALANSPQFAAFFRSLEALFHLTTIPVCGTKWGEVKHLPGYPPVTGVNIAECFPQLAIRIVPRHEGQALSGEDDRFFAPVLITRTTALSSDLPVAQYAILPNRKMGCFRRATGPISLSTWVASMGYQYVSPVFIVEAMVLIPLSTDNSFKSKFSFQIDTKGGGENQYEVQIVNGFEHQEPGYIFEQKQHTLDVHGHGYQKARNHFLLALFPGGPVVNENADGGGGDVLKFLPNALGRPIIYHMKVKGLTLEEATAADEEHLQKYVNSMSNFFVAEEAGQ